MIKEDSIWTEKYRPRKLKNIVGQHDIIPRLRSFVKSKNMPNLLFTGPPGVGKTAAAMCIARALFGNYWKANFTEINASDERGIDVVRTTIKQTAQTMPLGGANFKIIFLDEVDATTNDFQTALRRTMERYSNTCRFILSCNYSSKIIPPIQSRCSLFRFRRILRKDFEPRIKKICEKEGLTITDLGLGAINYVSDGDMRLAINTLQSAASISDKITAKAVYSTNSSCRPEDIIVMLNYATSGNFIQTRNQLDKLLINQGISEDELIVHIFKNALDMPINDKLKMIIIDRLGETDFKISEGANPRIQLEAFISHIMLKSIKYNKS